MVNERYFADMRAWVRERVAEALSGELDLSPFDAPGENLDETDLMTMYVLEARAMGKRHVPEHENQIVPAMVLEELVPLDRLAGRDPDARITNDHRRWVLDNLLDQYGVPHADPDD